MLLLKLWLSCKAFDLNTHSGLKILINGGAEIKITCYSQTYRLITCYLKTCKSHLRQLKTVNFLKRKIISLNIQYNALGKLMADLIKPEESRKHFDLTTEKKEKKYGKMVLKCLKWGSLTLWIFVWFLSSKNLLKSFQKSEKPLFRLLLRKPFIFCVVGLQKR